MKSYLGYTTFQEEMILANFVQPACIIIIFASEHLLQGNISQMSNMVYGHFVYFRIENLDKWCRDLKILYLQSNLIPKIGNYTSFLWYLSRNDSWKGYNNKENQRSIWFRIWYVKIHLQVDWSKNSVADWAFFHNFFFFIRLNKGWCQTHMCMHPLHNQF